MRPHHIITVLRRSPIWPLLRALYRRAAAAAPLVGIRQSPRRIADAAQRYWTTDALDAPHMSHWRGEGGLTDGQFDDMGRCNALRFEMAARALAFPTSDLRILEWGCGGGTNLAALADRARHLIGVDINDDSLQRTAKELDERSPGVPFTPIRVDVPTPDTALTALDEPVDLVVCVNVMELVPDPAYGLHLISLFNEALRPGGMAFVQIRYREATLRSRPAGAFYRANITRMTSYAVAEFWTACERLGLHPSYVTLHPEEDVIGERYAYFVLTRPENPT